MKLPDFNALFFETFAGKPRKLSVETRFGPNGQHDLFYIASLVNDARFHSGKMRLRKERLTLPIERDCWEHWNPENPEFSNLHSVRSKLTIEPVKDLEWHFPGESDYTKMDELWINSLDVCWRTHEEVAIQIAGYGWSLRMTTPRDEWSVKLRDLTKPELH